MSSSFAPLLPLLPPPAPFEQLLGVPPCLGLGGESDSYVVGSVVGNCSVVGIPLAVSGEQYSQPGSPRGHGFLAQIPSIPPPPKTYSEGSSGQTPGFPVPIFDDWLLREDSNPLLQDKHLPFCGVSVYRHKHGHGRRESWQSHLWTSLNEGRQLYLGMYPKAYLAAYARDCAYLFVRDLLNETVSVGKVCESGKGRGKKRKTMKEKRTNFPPEIYTGVLRKLKKEYVSSFRGKKSEYDMTALAKLMRKEFMKLFSCKSTRQKLPGVQKEDWE